MNIPESLSATSPILSTIPMTPALVVHDLWKAYPFPIKGNRHHKRMVVQGISFTLHAGEVLGLLGPNGAGKTTTVGMLYGAILPTRGHVQLDNLEVHTRNRLARAQIGVVTQDDYLDPEFSVVENLVSFARYYGMGNRAAKQRAQEVLALVHLEEIAHYRINRLSGGMQRRIVLARALLNRPKVVLLDEPTTGLDPDVRQDFWKLVIELKRQGCGILLTTHYMDEAQRLCDRLLLLQQGQVIDHGTPSELIQRTVGEEVVEIEGIPLEKLQELASASGTWCRAFGSSDLIALPIQHPDLLWEKLVALHPLRLTRRRASLEDVFLRLTGRSLV
jgi:lipooligosaccharide transport system ATP-binding protein